MIAASEVSKSRDTPPKKLKWSSSEKMASARATSDKAVGILIFFIFLDVGRGMDLDTGTSIPLPQDGHVALVPVISFNVLTAVRTGKCGIVLFLGRT